MKKVHEQGRVAVNMRWPHPGQDLEVKMVLLSHDNAAERDGKCCASEMLAKVKAGICMWCTDRSRRYDRRVGAGALCKDRDGWRTFHGHLGPKRIEVHDGEL